VNTRPRPDREHPFTPLTAKKTQFRTQAPLGVKLLEDRLLYRVTEVAVFLNIGRSKVYELLGAGDLPSVKIDRTRLVRGSDLRQYVESLRHVVER
jgi:excisionase family DNA binding protein